jgi:hypothetical protein
MSPEKRKALVARCNKTKYIICMHPHGIIPFQAAIWAAFCDQYLRDETNTLNLYGFGAAADVVMFLPFLRNWMGWLTAGSAEYKVLKRGIVEVIFTVLFMHYIYIYILQQIFHAAALFQM